MIDVIELVDLVAAAEGVPREQVAVVVRAGEVIVEAHRVGSPAARVPLGPHAMRDVARRLLTSAELREQVAIDALAQAERELAARTEALAARRATLARLTELAEMPAPPATTDTQKGTDE